MDTSKNSKQPWTVPGVPWKTESAFWAWVRGVLRKGWSKHPVKLEYIKQNRQRIPNPKPSKRFPEVWGMECAICHQSVVQSEIEIDHISDNGGTFRGLEDIRDYAAYLFLVDFASLRSVCKPCHTIISYSQKMNISFEEAKLAKDVIAFSKLSLDGQAIILNKLGADSIAKTKAGRVEQYKNLNGLK